MGQQRPHVPYRNSMMTQVLRDSLGGNCRTVMIANITAQHEQLDASISTCRFAQRVAMVSNQVWYMPCTNLQLRFPCHIQLELPVTLLNMAIMTSASCYTQCQCMKSWRVSR